MRRSPRRTAPIGLVALSVLVASCGQPAEPPEPDVPEVTLSSEAFDPGGPIPSRYTCDGQDVSPPLSWGDPPEGARSWALVCDDPDAPGGSFVHWILYDLPAESRSLPEGVEPGQETLTDLPGVEGDASASQGRNDFGDIGYGGPCPPEGERHEYHVTISALDVPELSLPPGASSEDLYQAIEGHIVAQGELVGTYQRTEGAEPGGSEAPTPNRPGPR